MAKHAVTNNGKEDMPSSHIAPPSWNSQSHESDGAKKWETATAKLSLDTLVTSLISIRENSGHWIQICCRIFARKHSVRQVGEDIPQVCSRVPSSFIMQSGAPRSSEFATGFYLGLQVRHDQKQLTPPRTSLFGSL